MTSDELKHEWQVTYDTRLGILCGTDKPTNEQVDIAFAEAEEHVKDLRGH